VITAQLGEPIPLSNIYSKYVIIYIVAIYDIYFYIYFKKKERSTPLFFVIGWLSFLDSLPMSSKHLDIKRKYSYEKI